MGEKESHGAAVDARRDVAHRATTGATCTDAVGRYLACVAYQTAHDRRADREEDPAERPEGPARR